MTTQQWNAQPGLAQLPYLAQQPRHVQPSSMPLAAVAPTPRAAAPTDDELWATVRTLRSTVADLIQAEKRPMDQADREQLGRAFIQTALREHQQSRVDRHQPPLGAEAEHTIGQRIHNAIFGLGRLQPLVDLPGAVDIEIYGCDRVHVLFADGHREWGPPVAGSDAELILDLQILAARDPHNERPFSPAHPFLEMPLPNRGRLAAVAFAPTRRPRVTIRLQHLRNVDLAQLREQDEIDTVLEQFLASAVLARKTIVVSGQGQGSGKTTLLRALCAAIPAHESVATIEDTYELWLGDDPARHPRVTDMQAFAGAGETDGSGHPKGRITTDELLRRSLRHNIDRIIVGEVREPGELLAMFAALQAGNGSMSTIHADSAHDVVERLVGLAVRDASVGENYAYRQIAATIDLIVFLGVQTNPDGSKTRYIREIIEPTRGEGTSPVATTDLFVPGPAGRAVPNIAPSFMPDLAAVGFNPALMATRGTWRHQ